MADPTAEPTELAETNSVPRPPRWPTWLGLFLFCFGAGSAAFFVTKPLYRAEGILEFTPAPAWNMRGLRAEPVDPLFVDRQAELIRTLPARAMLEKEWTTLRPNKPTARDLAEFQRSIETVARPNHLVYVRFVHADADLAQAGVASLVNSYGKTYTSRLRSERENVLKAFEERKSLLGGSMARLDTQILKIAEDFGTGDLSALHAAKLSEVTRLERELGDSEVRVDSATRPATQALAAPHASMRIRYENARAAFSEIGRARLKIDDIKRQRDELVEERRGVQRRIDELNLEGTLAPQLTVLSVGVAPTAYAVDHRLRNTAAAAVGAMILFFLLRALWRALRTLRVRRSARTAFPVVMHYDPRPVIPIPETPGAPAPAQS